MGFEFAPDFADAPNNEDSIVVFSPEIGAVHDKDYHQLTIEKYSPKNKNDYCYDFKCNTSCTEYCKESLEYEITHPLLCKEKEFCVIAEHVYCEGLDQLYSPEKLFPHSISIPFIEIIPPGEYKIVFKETPPDECHTDNYENWIEITEIISLKQKR